MMELTSGLARSGQVEERLAGAADARVVRAHAEAGGGEATPALQKHGIIFHFILAYSSQLLIVLFCSSFTQRRTFCVRS